MMVEVGRLLILWFGIRGAGPKVRKIEIRVNVDLASLPGSPGFLNSDWVQVHAGHITSADISAWSYSVGILVRFTSFLSHLHWPSGSVDMGHFGVSFLELLILFEQWTGHRLLSEKVTRPHVRLAVQFRFPLFLFQKELKFDMGANLLAFLLGLLGNSWWIGLVFALSGWFSLI